MNIQEMLTELRKRGLNDIAISKAIGLPPSGVCILRNGKTKPNGEPIDTSYQVGKKIERLFKKHKIKIIQF